VVVAPGWGDAVQVAKAGILEVADVFVVNKSDRDGAATAVRDLEAMIRLGTAGGWAPPVVKAAAGIGTGADVVWAAVERHRSFMEERHRLAESRRSRLALEVVSLAAEELRGSVAAALEADPGLRDDLVARRLDPYRAAATLLEAVGAAPRRTAGRR
jgi:LAO/AO transport system kinase